MKRTKAIRRYNRFLLFVSLGFACFCIWQVLSDVKIDNMLKKETTFKEEIVSALTPKISSNTSNNPYTIISKRDEEIHTGDLILINPYYASKNINIESFVSVYYKKNSAYKVKDKNVLLQEHVIKGFNNLMSDFEQGKSNENINIVSGYRTEKEQQSLLNKKVKQSSSVEASKWVAKAGYSEHHSGLALDLGLFYSNGTSGDFDGKGKYAWLLEHCFEYGFIVRYQEHKTSITQIENEPWHFRYVGLPHSFVIQQNDFCMEEYIDYLKNFPYDSEHLEVTWNEKNYEIYYVEGTNVPVPNNGEYEVSGNNVDGFIVTVEK